MVFSSADKELIATCFTEKGWRGTKILQEFPGKNWRKNSVDNLIRKIETTGSTERKSGSGRPKTVCTQENVDYVEEHLCSQDNPGTHKSQRKIANDLGVSRTSVRNMTKQLGLKSYKRIKVSRRDEKVKQKRKTRCKNLDDKYSAKDVEKMVFTDEKDFSLEIARNRQNDRVYGKRKRDIPVKRLYHQTSRFTKKVMVSAGVSWRGKTRIHFIDTAKTKVNSESYIRLLDRGLLTDCRRLYPANDYIFQQDGATSHTSRRTQQHMEDVVPAFIKKDEWPPQSPDCNPMDYSVWNSLSEKVYEGRTEKFSEEELKARIKRCWKKITLKEIQSSIGSWKKRLRTVSRENGGPIDHLFK
jgi:transposase